MSMWTRRDTLPVAPLSGVPEYAKELFEIVEMRSLTPDYFEQFEARLRTVDPSEDGSWTIGLLRESDSPVTTAINDSLPLVPTILVVTVNGLVLFDEASAEIVLSCTWDRMCRVDLKPVEEGDYQIFAFSSFSAPMSVAERFSGLSSWPLDSSEVDVRYLYTHANPSTFKEIDRHWSGAHIPQDLHQIPSLLG